ncbi:MAG: hypothetical protein IPP60_16820 [Sphingobacteriales bacterium]|nr:hypothetical protein [Sphingobacteriales bacterium]
MIKVSTLRNIITLLAALFFVACRTNTPAYSDKGELKSISSEEKYTELTQLAEVVDEDGSRMVFVISKK